MEHQLSERFGLQPCGLLYYNIQSHLFKVLLNLLTDHHYPQKVEFFTIRKREMGVWRRYPMGDTLLRTQVGSFGTMHGGLMQKI